jgi:hypothetical protein
VWFRQVEDAKVRSQLTIKLGFARGSRFGNCERP